MLLILVVSILFLYLAKLISKWEQRQKPLKEIFPFAPAKVPILTFAMKYVDGNNSLSYTQTLMEQCDNKSFVAWAGPVMILAVCDPHLAEILLSSNVLIDKLTEYRSFNNWFGDSLLISTGQKWRNKRKILTPSFHYKILEDFVEVFDEKSKVLVKKLEKESNGTTFDIYDYATLCTLDIICKTAMGTDLNCQEDADHEFVTSNKTMCDIIYRRMVTHLRFDWVYNLTKLPKLERESIKVMRSYSQAVIDNRRKILKQNREVENPEVDQFGIKNRKTFLDVLLNSTIDGKPLTDQEICEEVDTFIFEGHDTTANAISFTIYLLGQHRDAQQKVYEEILEVIGPEKEAAVNYEQLQNLKYMEMFIKESLRLYPAVAAFGRTLSQDVPYENKIIPKGTDVFISAYHMHRNKRVYEDPEKFDPERFNLENSLKRHPYAYIPFSAGPRNCIGQRFAMLEMKSTISKILRFYEIVPVPNFEVYPICKVTIQSSTGIKVQIKHRN